MKNQKYCGSGFLRIDKMEKKGNTNSHKHESNF